MNKKVSRWIIPIVFNIIFILPYLRIFDFLPLGLDQFGYLYYSAQFIGCFVLLVRRKSNYAFFFFGLLIATGLLGLIMLIERHTIFEPLTVFRHERWAGIAVYLITIFSFITQTAAALLALLVLHIKNKR
ncbi:MAG: hypothetical protein IJH80_07605 [Ruminococcus sp.]|nr:hypothetical protein [Ruminococcus sp.]